MEITSKRISTIPNPITMVTVRQNATIISLWLAANFPILKKISETFIILSIETRNNILNKMIKETSNLINALWMQLLIIL